MHKFLSSWIPNAAKPRLFNRFRQSLGHKIRFTAGDYAAPDAFPSPYENTYAGENPLQELGAQYQPTKRLHNYLPYYWRHFRDIRYQVERVLEIGLQTDRSIRMWEAFFPNATIYGIDIDPSCRSFAGGRRKIHIGSQADPVFLQTVVDEAGGAFDIVIDDGSHYVNHQLISFDFLFPRLTDHGIYVIEDTGACVRDYEMKTVHAISDLLKHIYYPTHDIGVEHAGDLSVFPAEASWADRNIRGIAFYRWICFIERGLNPSDNPFLNHG